MEPETIAAMSAATVTLAQIFKGFINQKLALPLAGLLALVSVGLWAYSHNDFARETTWNYFVAYGLVLSSAAGVFGLINQGAQQITNIGGAGRAMVNSTKAAGHAIGTAITGTGDGSK